MRKFRNFRYFCLLTSFILLVGCIHKPKPNLSEDPQQRHKQYLEKCQQWLGNLETHWYQFFKKKVETKHFVFYLFEDKPWEEVDTVAQEEFYEYITKLFGVELKEKIIYIKCRNKEDVERLTGDKRIVALAASGLNLIISPEDWENHELVHIFTIGGSAFFREGLATAFQIDLSRGIFYPYPYWKRQPAPPHIHSYLQNKIIKNGKYISISDILTSESFRADEEKIIEIEKIDFRRATITYLEAGSFVRYLIDVYGLERFFQFLKLSDYSDSKSEIEEKFLKVYSISIQEMEEQWLNFLETNY